MNITAQPAAKQSNRQGNDLILTVNESIFDFVKLSIISNAIADVKSSSIFFQ